MEKTRGANWETSRFQPMRDQKAKTRQDEENKPTGWKETFGSGGNKRRQFNLMVSRTDPLVRPSSVESGPIESPRRESEAATANG